MSAQSDVVELSELLERLRAADVQHRVFGSKKHGYRVGPTLTESEIVAFEAENTVRLPEDYRCFLKVVGNGGAGPYYGLEPLGKFGRVLSQPFPLTTASDQMSDGELDALGDGDDFPGVLEFCHQGCTIYAYLVVNGPTYGTIWNGREDFYPTGRTFGCWYRDWLERSLRALDSERHSSRLQLGMTSREVVAAVGGKWEARQIPSPHGGPIVYLESPDFPAQLELDERGQVIKIIPWPFI